MIRIKTIWISLIAILLGSTLLITGCQKEPAVQEIPPDPFTTTWNLREEGRALSVSGDSAGHVPGEESEFLLMLDNLDCDAPWQGEYCILLIDNEGIIKEITHEQFNVPVGLKTQKPFTIEFPKDCMGPVGLCVIIPQRATMVTTLWIGTCRTGDAGPWPNIKTCPYYLTEEGSRELAEEFVHFSPTFKFDGNQATLELVETLYPDIENAWQFVFRFESTHAGYGDRTGQMLAQVITPHEAVITVEQGEIKNAVMDGKWDMINQEMLNEIEISLAPIHEVAVQFMESFPVQIGVYIKGGLKDGCTTFDDAVVTREGDTINIEVTVQRPKEAICDLAYRFFEENLNLGSDFIAGTTYTLAVNEYTTTFKIP